MPAAIQLPIAPDDLAELRRWARSSQLPAVLARRAWILLLAADGVSNTEIAQRVGGSRPTVIACRRRSVRRGLAGLADRYRPARPQTVRRLRRTEILQVTLNPPPARPGITHWSTRLLARELGVGRDTIARVWRESRAALAGRDLQVLHRPEQRTHDYPRHGTTVLFAALEVATGRVTNQCAPHHRHQEFLAFLKQVARTNPRRRLHLICDNDATHTHPVVRSWLAKHPHRTALQTDLGVLAQPGRSVLLHRRPPSAPPRRLSQRR